MSTVTLKPVWTEEQLLSLPDIGHKIELIDGRLVMAPAGFEHGQIALVIASHLMPVVRAGKLGQLADSSTGFWMKSENLRCPDLSFVAAERLRGLKRLPKGFFRGAPDLAVEIISPSDTARDLHERIVEYFENGCRLAWLVNPDERTVMVYHDATPERLLKLGDTLDGETVVPGFRLALAEIFAPLEP